MLLCRGHSQEAAASHVAAGGKDWDTVKPLHKWFKHLHRVLLMDDDAYKAGYTESCFLSNTAADVCMTYTAVLLCLMLHSDATRCFRHVDLPHCSCQAATTCVVMPVALDKAACAFKHRESCCYCCVKLPIVGTLHNAGLLWYSKCSHAAQQQQCCIAFLQSCYMALT